MVVHGGLALIMDGHGVILLLHSARLVLSGLHHFGFLVLINVILIIVLVARQLVLVAIRDITFARGFSSGFCFIAVFLILR
jgi:hypothetical protein